MKAFPFPASPASTASALARFSPEHRFQRYHFQTTAVCVFWIFRTLLLLLIFTPRLQAQTPVEQKLPEIGPGSQPGWAKITWPGVSGRVYFIMVSTDLQSWSYAPFVDLGAGANLSWQFQTNGGRGYLRLKYSVDTDQTAGRLGDLDGDGLNNETEVTTTHTDPDNPDSDLDGMPDGWEILYGLNPLTDDSALDSDNDGLKNPLEYQLGTKPKRVGTDDGTDSDGDGLKDGEEYNEGHGLTDPAKFDMPILSVMEYSREATLDDMREPAYAGRHTWTASATFRYASGKGVNGAGISKPAWLNPGPWQTAGALNAAGASNSFFDEVQGPLAWGDPQSAGTTLHAWLRQVYSWEPPYRTQHVRTRQIRYFVRASRSMPIELKVRAMVTRYTRQGALDAAWSTGANVETNTLTLAAKATDSNEFTLNPTTYQTVTPWNTTDTTSRSVGDSYFTVSIQAYPYTVTGSDSDGDGLSNTIETSMGTNPGNADTDGDGRKDFFDFISVRAGALAPAGKTSIKPSTPIEEEQPWIEYVWREGHLCPAYHWSQREGDKNVINSHPTHWDYGVKDDVISPAPISSTAAMKTSWTNEPDFPLELPGTDAPPAPVLDESKDISTVLYSHNLLRNYTTTSTWPGGDGREVLFRLRRNAASSKPFSRTFLIVDRQKADTAATDWTYNKITPYTLTIEATKTVSPAVSLTANPLKLPDTIPAQSGKSSDHQVLGLVVEVVDKDMKPVTRLQVGKMSEPLVLSGTVDAPSLNIDKDSDRFYLRIKGGAELGVVTMKVSTGGNPDSSYNDSGALVELNPQGKDALSKSLLLVADDVDDDFPVDSIADNALNDRTFKTQLGGNFQIESVKISTKPAETTDIKVPIPVTKTVSFGATILRNKAQTAGGTPTVTESSVTQDLKVANERFAQVGINFKLSGSITTADPPSGVNLADGLTGFTLNGNGVMQLYAEEKALLDKLATADSNDRQVFYINFFTSREGGEAISSGLFPSENDRKYTGNAILPASRLKYSLAHELGHLLQNSGDHFPEGDINLMSGGIPAINGLILDSKRLLPTQEKIMIK